MITNETVKAIIEDHIIDPWTQDVSDMADSEFITLEESALRLAEFRNFDAECELDNDERIPDDVTPEMVREVWNNMIRSGQTEMTIRLMADFLNDNECVCEYDIYYANTVDNAQRVVPVDFLLYEDFPFALKDGEAPVAIDLILIGQNSKNSLRMSDAYCWFDAKKLQLFSTNTPFKDGIIDAEAVARYMIEEDPDFLEYMKEHVMDEDDIKRVFKYMDEK